MKKMFAFFCICAVLVGCTTKYTGSRTLVGEQLAMPELSDSADTVSLRVYESVKGAKVWTAKDSRVSIKYANAYTNNYFGLVESQNNMKLDVLIEPKAGDADTDCACAGDCKCNPCRCTNCNCATNAPCKVTASLPSI